MFRQDWTNFIDESIVQVNLAYSYPDIIRVWHRHYQGQADYFLLLKGAMKIWTYDKETKGLAEVIASDDKPMSVIILEHYYHGLKTISNEPGLTVYFVNRLYEYEKPDEQRIPWDDPRIVPSEVNDNKDDSRVNHPWDWFYPPHK